MNTAKQILTIAQTDKTLDCISLFDRYHSTSDRDHLERRQQQRAINDLMIQIALKYGQKRFDHRGAVIYTLSDRSLQNSPYVKFSDRLRGLQVVCKSNVEKMQVITTYWNFSIKKRVR
jgi:hypothetical protein